MSSRTHKHPSFWQDLVRDWNTLKNLSQRQRVLFVWDYYRWRILAAVCIVIAVISLVSILWEGQKPCRLRVCAVLNTDADYGDWFASFAKELQSDGKPGAVDINLDQPFDSDNPYYYVQEMEIMAAVSSGRMDAAVCNEDLYQYLLALNACLPLDQGLPEDVYTALLDSGKLVYGTANLTTDENGFVDPDNGIDGYYAMNLSDTEFAQLYNQTGSDNSPLYAVIISNTEHLEECISLIKALSGL